MTLAAIGMLTFAQPVVAQDENVCDEESGAAFGLCTSYCEAMDCDGGAPEASANACASVATRFLQATGRDLPCEVSGSGICKNDSCQYGIDLDSPLEDPSCTYYCTDDYPTGNLICSSLNNQWTCADR